LLLGGREGSFVQDEQGTPLALSTTSVFVDVVQAADCGWWQQPRHDMRWGTHAATDHHRTAGLWLRRRQGI